MRFANFSFKILRFNTSFSCNCCYIYYKVSDAAEKREGDGREKRFTLPFFSPLYIGISGKNGRKGGTFSNSFVFLHSYAGSPLFLRRLATSPIAPGVQSEGFGLTVRPLRTLSPSARTKTNNPWLFLNNPRLFLDNPGLLPKKGTLFLEISIILPTFVIHYEGFRTF